MTLSGFLLARIAEDEADAETAAGLRGEYPFARDDFGRLLVAPARVLAECEAKRRIVELHKEWPVLVESPPEFTSEPDLDSMTFRMSKQIAWTTEQKYREHFGSEPPAGPILRALAAIYADHPDYDPAWA